MHTRQEKIKTRGKIGETETGHSIRQTSTEGTKDRDKQQIGSRWRNGRVL